MILFHKTQKIKLIKIKIKVTFLLSDLFCLFALGRAPSNITISSSYTDIDDCASHPCKNNGTCTDRVNGFNCSCAPGFNGTQCETGDYIQDQFSFIFQEFLNHFHVPYSAFIFKLLEKGRNIYIFVVAVACFADIVAVGYIVYHKALGLYNFIRGFRWSGTPAGIISGWWWWGGGHVNGIKIMF